MEKLIVAFVLFCVSGSDYNNCTLDAPPSILKKVEEIRVKPAACGFMTQQYVAALNIPLDTYPKILCYKSKETKNDTKSLPING